MVWKDLSLLVNIKAIQLGFLGFLKQVGCFIRFVRLYDLQKDFMVVSSILALKSPRKTTFSYLPSPLHKQFQFCSIKPKRLLAKRELPLLFRCNFLTPKCSSFMLSLSIRGMFFWLQKFFSLALVSMRCLSQFRLSFR